jgi:6-phosphofructokinase
MSTTNTAIIPATATTTGVANQNQIVLPQENDMATLSSAIVEWRRISDECANLKEQLKERGKKIKVLQEVIVRIMKNHNVAALDLKNTGGRIITKQRKSQSGLTPKTLQQTLATYLKSEEEAKKALEYIQSQRQISTRDALLYEKP